MPINLCPSCESANPAGARFCNACGRGLLPRCPNCAAVNEAWRDTCEDCGTVLQISIAIDEAPLQETIEPVGDPTIDGLTLVLLDVADPGPEPGFEAAPAPAIELIQSDPDDPRFAGSLPPVTPVLQTAAATSTKRSRADAKTARRAAVRRKLMARAPTEAAPRSGPTDVLVMDENERTRTLLCQMLEGFGFGVYPARGPFEVTGLLGVRPYAAVFLDVVLDGTDQNAAAELCQLVKASPTPVGTPALIIVSGDARPVDRVRATLAGANAFLVKPVGRGDIAGALNACGIPLPSDPRRA